MATGKTGGLNWFGVGTPGRSETTASSVLLNRSKRQRQEAALRGQRVGSAAIQSADDWYATVEANRQFHKGAVGNPFKSPAALLAESQRQEPTKVAVNWAVFDDHDDGDGDEARGERSAGLYWDDPRDFQWDVSGDDDDDLVEADDDPRTRRDEATSAPTEETPRPPPEEPLSREERRKVEVSVMELRAELEAGGVLDDDAVDARCDALRRRLLESRGAAAAAAAGKKKKRTAPRGPAEEEEDGQLTSPDDQSQSPSARGVDAEKEGTPRDDLAPLRGGGGGVVVDFDDDDRAEEEEEEPPPSVVPPPRAASLNDDPSPPENTNNAPLRGVVVDFDDDD